MSHDQRLRHEVAEFMPSTIEAGVIYISLDYLTAIHRCCCGCGEKVVTPVGPTDWSVTFHGDSVSLDPSIGNWGLACGSHYIIRRSRVIWAGQWTPERIEAGRRADVVQKQRYYQRGTDSKAGAQLLEAHPVNQAADRPTGRRSWWRRLLGLGS